MTGKSRVCLFWQQTVPIPQFSTGFFLWNEVGCPEPSWGNSHQGDTWHGSLHRDTGSPPGWRCPQLPTVPLVKPQTWLWRVWLWKSTMLEGVIKNISFQSCALIFLSAVQAFLWKLETKRPLKYGATWKQRHQRTWDRKGNCFPHVPNMEHRQGRQGVSCYDISFVVPTLCQLGTVGCELWANVHPRIMGFSEPPLFFSLCCFCTAERWPWQIAWLLEVTPKLVHWHSKDHSGFKTWRENTISILIYKWLVGAWGQDAPPFLGKLGWERTGVAPLAAKFGTKQPFMKATRYLGKILSVF